MASKDPNTGIGPLDGDIVTRKEIKRSMRGGKKSMLEFKVKRSESKGQNFLFTRTPSRSNQLSRKTFVRHLCVTGLLSLILSIICSPSIQVAQALQPTTATPIHTPHVTATPTPLVPDSGTHIGPFPQPSTWGTSLSKAEIFLSGVSFYLPWRGGQTWDTTNGNCGDGHSCDPANEYAWDFVPKGSASDQIVAVADGTVCYVQNNIPDSTIFSGPHAGNVIVIVHQGNCTEHQDGVYSFYAHLKWGSTTVNNGQSVARGTVIAREGQSGYAWGPHLHFSVNRQYWTYTQYNWKTASGITIAANFSDADVQSDNGVPRAGTDYISDNYLTTPPCTPQGMASSALTPPTTLTLANSSMTTVPLALGETIVGEVGKIVDALTNTSQTVILTRSYTKPVVFAQPFTYDGSDPGVVRITEVQANSFSLYLHEAPNMNGSHTTETVSYVVLEEGTWRLTDGTVLQVGIVNTTATVGKQISNVWQQINFGISFQAAPVVISQVQTENDPYWVKTRQQNVMTTGFEVGLEEDEGSTSPHGSETIGWLAIEAGLGTWSGHTYIAAQTGNAVTDSWCQISFGQAFENIPRFVSSLMTYDGKDGAYLRYRDLTVNGVDIKAEEDTTYDNETEHATEIVSYLVIENNGTLMAERQASTEYLLYLPIVVK